MESGSSRELKCTSFDEATPILVPTQSQEKFHRSSSAT